MVSRLKIALAELFIFCLRVADYICSLFGHAIFQVTLENVLHNLSPAELAEAEEPCVCTPLALYAQDFRKTHIPDGYERFAQLMTMKNLLKRRAGITRAIRENPDVLKMPVSRPVFIVGFPRSATTLLFNLLSQDAAFRSPMLWEMMAPYPPGRPDNWRECDRYTKIKEQLGVFNRTKQAFQAVHDFKPENPEECIFILDKSFLQYFCMLRFPKFTNVTDWYYSLRSKDLVPVYEHYKKTLQVIGYKDLHSKRLLLKSHLHLLCLDVLLQLFPDARFIFTYRKMSEQVASFASMFYKSTDGWGPLDKDYGKRVVRFMAELANRGVDTMKKYDHLPQEQNPFFKVSYKTFVKDPLATIRQFYAQNDMVLSPESEHAMRGWLAEHPQHKSGKHQYSLEEYGLTQQDIVDSMAPYLDYFKGQEDLI